MKHMPNGKTNRDQRVATYLAESTCPRLAIGVWKLPLEGWLNTDLNPVGPDVLPLDVTKPFPFDSDVFDYVASEHMIEHVSLGAGRHMLAESLRVLKPGGRIRIATPDLQRYLQLFSPQLTPVQREFVDWMVQTFMPDALPAYPTYVLNNLFYNFGHQAIYDFILLSAMVRDVGFEDVKEYPPGVSDCEVLRGIEMHGKAVGEDINEYETMVLEARKPDVKTSGL
jgi:SAM-dependent methyltransferase